MSISIAKNDLLGPLPLIEKCLSILSNGTVKYSFCLNGRVLAICHLEWPPTVRKPHKVHLAWRFHAGQAAYFSIALKL